MTAEGAQISFDGFNQYLERMVDIVMPVVSNLKANITDVVFDRVKLEYSARVSIPRIVITESKVNTTYIFIYSRVLQGFVVLRNIVLRNIVLKNIVLRNIEKSMDEYKTLLFSKLLYC